MDSQVEYAVKDTSLIATGGMIILVIETCKCNTHLPLVYGSNHFTKGHKMLTVSRIYDISVVSLIEQ